MLRQPSTWLLLASVLFAFAFGAAPARLHAQDEAAETQQKPDKDFYQVPDGSVDELLAFIEKVRTFQPTNVLEVFAHRKKAGQAISDAADKILELEKDKTSEAYKTAYRLKLQVEVGSLATASPEEQVRVFQKVTKQIEDEGVTEQTLALAYQTASGLEHGGNDQLAAKAYETYADKFTKVDNEQIASIAERFVGAARRLRLPGQPIKVTGTDLEGNAFDWKEYKGKVVLIDFWATWCGPCREELPNIKALYEKYHDKGFEVVGISIDQNRLAVEEYVDNFDVPWVTLHEDNGQGEQPTADYYGVFSIPTMILVGRDGKVVSLYAQGEALRDLLAEQFGEKKEAAGE